jgi:hypothetical protein
MIMPPLVMRFPSYLVKQRVIEFCPRYVLVLSTTCRKGVTGLEQQPNRKSSLQRLRRLESALLAAESSASLSTERLVLLPPLLS